MQKLVLKKTNIKDLGLILLEIVTGILFFIFVGLFVNNEYRIAKEIASLIMRCTLLILIFFIGSLYYTEYFIKMHNKDMIDEEELTLAKIRSEIYKNQIEDADKIRSMYHDMKNHILVLNDEMLESEEQEKYILILKKKIEEFDDYIHTGNQYLDIILKEKMRVCKENDITLDVQINLCEISVLDPVEICVLFGNLLDNAIEANKFISDPQKRNISITAHKKNMSFMIRFINPMEKPLAWSKNGLATTKKDSAYHGFGMKNIIKIVDDKNGQYSIKTENNKFVICIILPLEC
ncbi:MAG TPA: GHKL domain-containing protein [Candidatus Merdenecus merdavium]|nr:GHKL domain-containing protein [Candidatus Merdenecus merdavium]